MRSIVSVLLPLLCFVSLGIAKPNIVFLIIDDTSPDDLGPYGNHVIQTPHLDQLASEGLVFEQAYLTTSSCSPSRCSFITGRYPHNTGAPELHTVLPSSQHTFVRDLQAAGYYTMLAGTNHINPEASELGFDEYVPGTPPSGSSHWVEVLAARPKDQPFFAWLASNDAHRRWTIDERAPTYRPEDMIIPPFLYDSPELRQDLADFYHEVSRTDTALGEVRAELRRQGVDDETVIVFCADNGRPFHRCKTRLYDSGIKTPLLIWFPESISPGRVSSIVSNIDIAPTILELAGLTVGPTFQGVSLTPLFADPKATVRDVAFAEHNWHVYQNHERMVRTGDWLYIRNAFPERRTLSAESNGKRFPGDKAQWKAYEEGLTYPFQENVFLKPRPAEELYHVGADPHQLFNLAQDPIHQTTLKQLSQLLDRWITETGDNIPDQPTPDGGTSMRDDIQRGDLAGAKHEEEKILNSGPVRL